MFLPDANISVFIKMRSAKHADPAIKGRSHLESSNHLELLAPYLVKPYVALSRK